MGDRLLLGRDPEQAAITAGLDAARNDLSRALLLRGGPGMGKSALLRFAQEAGADLRQLTVSGVESRVRVSLRGRAPAPRPTAR